MLKLSLLLSVILLSFGVAASGLKSEAISASSLQQSLDSQHPPLVVDIRSPDQYSSGHIPGSISIPVPLLNRNLETLKNSDDLVLYCNDSRLTRVAEGMLMRKKVDGFRHLGGGFNAWSDAELPIETSLD